MFNSPSTRCAPAAGCRCRPQLEVLEQRLLLKVNFFNNVDLDRDGQFDDFRIVGDKQNSRVFIDEDPAEGGLWISIDADGNGNFNQAVKGDFPRLFFPGIDSAILDISLGGGIDLVAIKALSPFAGGSRSYQINLGSGNDKFIFDMQGHSVTGNTFLDINVSTFSGNDTVDVVINDISGSLVALNIAAGGGSDDVSLDFTGTIGGGSRVQADCSLGAGNNGFFLNLGTLGDAFGFGMFNVNVEGGPLVDNLQVEFDGPVGDGLLASFLIFSANLGAGNDFLFLDLRDAFGVRANSMAAISVRGGSGHDLLDVDDDFMAQDLQVAAGAWLSIELLGESGSDTIDLVLDQPLNPFHVSLLGTVHVRLNGGNGNDAFSLHLGNDLLSTGNYDVALFGGAGNDFATFDFEGNGALVSFNPLSFILLDGGAGANSLTNGNPTVTRVRFF